jgi:undecaprenol kinase
VRQVDRRRRTAPHPSRSSSARKFLRSFGFAAAGIVSTAAREQNFRVHLVAAALAIVAGIALRIDATEWALVVVAIAGVLALELLNTAVEAVVDLASPERHPLAERAKDAAAGAVLVGAMGAAMMGAIIFVPRLAAAVGL